MDYLPIQASAVPCERVFSSSAETDTKKRNRIKPELMEALQVLKFALKKDCLDFTANLYLPEHTMTANTAESTKTLMEMLEMTHNVLKAFLDTLNFDDWNWFTQILWLAIICMYYYCLYAFTMLLKLNYDWFVCCCTGMWLWLHNHKRVRNQHWEVTYSDHIIQSVLSSFLGNFFYYLLLI